MRRFANKNFVASASLATLLIAAVVAAASFASADKRNDAGALATPVVYKVKEAPPVTPEEARRAVSSAKELSTAFRVAADKVLPAVVTIENQPKPVMANRRGMPRGENPQPGQNPFQGTPFEDFFRDTPWGQGLRFEMPPARPQPREGGFGSGVIIDASGLVLTCNHVVAGNGDVTVRLADGREFKAAQVWTDPKTDIAVVKIDGAKDLVAAPMGDSDETAIGDWVLALGQPFGLESTVTAGIISAKHRGPGIAKSESFLQTDAPINPGNSGGPLVNLDGEVVGINSAISSRSGGNEGIGFAVPINLARWVSEQLVSNGTVHRAYLGVTIQPVTAALAGEFHVKPREGVVVSEALPNTPAKKAGVKAGDVIIEYAGVAVKSPQDLQLLVERSEIGKPHVMTVVRDGKRMDLRFVPEEQPSDFGANGRSLEQSPATSQDTLLERLGLEVSDLDAAVAQQLGLKGVEGVVITGVRPDSPGERAQLETGMVITQLNRQPVKSVSDLTRALDKSNADEGLLLLIRTANGSRYVVLKP